MAGRAVQLSEERIQGAVWGDLIVPDAHFLDTAKAEVRVLERRPAPLVVVRELVEEECTGLTAP